MKASSFFITGTPRSGTTLLSVLLENHSEIYIDGDSVGISLAREMGQFKRLFSANPTADQSELLEQVCKNSYKGRLHNLFDFAHIREYPDFRSFFRRSILKKAQSAGKNIWGDKTPELIFHIPQTLEVFPEARFIHVVRDAHSNVSSLVKRQYYHPKLAAQYWKEINGLALMYEKLLSPKQFHIIRYEALLQDPKSSMEGVCKFLDIDFEAQMLNLDQSDATSGEHAYVDAQIDSSRLDKWKKKMTQSEILVIEKIAGDLLADLGYEVLALENPAKANSLTNGQVFWLKQRMIFKMLFKGKRVQMINRQLLTSRISFGTRLKNFTFATMKQFLSEDFIRIFKRS